MANPVFNMLMGNRQQTMPFDRNGLISKFNQFRQSFQGDPRQKVQELLDSGKMSQDDFNRLSGMANQLQGMFR